MAKRQVHDWVEEVPPDDVHAMIRSTFSFLVSDHQFMPPRDRSTNGMAIIKTYRGKHLAIEPIVDRKDMFVQTRIVRLKGGAYPNGYKIDSKGEQFATRLFEAAMDLKISLHRPSRSAESPHDALQMLLDDEVKMLREGFPGFLADEDEYFDDLNRRRSADAAVMAQDQFFESAEVSFRAGDYADLVKQLDGTRYSLSKLWDARLAYARKRM